MTYCLKPWETRVQMLFPSSDQTLVVDLTNLGRFVSCDSVEEAVIFAVKILWDIIKKKKMTQRQDTIQRQTTQSAIAALDNQLSWSWNIPQVSGNLNFIVNMNVLPPSTYYPEKTHILSWKDYIEKTILLKRPWCLERFKVGGEEGMTEDEMAGWHHRLDGCQFG